MALFSPAVFQKVKFLLNLPNEIVHQTPQAPTGAAEGPPTTPLTAGNPTTPQALINKAPDSLTEILKLLAILSSLRDGVIAINNTRTIVFVNPVAEKITGYFSVEMVGQPLDNLIQAKDANNQRIILSNYCQSTPPHNQGLPNVPFVVSLIGKNGQVVQVELIPVKVDQGSNRLSAVLMLHDITREKAFEQMQIDFVSMASHEFRTPLTTINNYLSVLKEEAGKDLSKEHQDFLDRSILAAKEMSALVENLLNVSKIERGSISLSLKLLDIKSLVENLVKDAQMQSTKKNLYLTFKPTKDKIPQVMADEVRITEVVNNLISNAINYTKEGGHIEVSVTSKGKEVIIAVKDDGVGIPKEALPNLFHKFYRAPGALKEIHKGSGLGLYISKSIIDLHKGKIWVESTEGKGSTFYFSLPEAGSTGSPTIVQFDHH